MVRDRGITLIELVVAMALFGLIAVMGLQALGAMMHQRDRLTTTEAVNVELSTTLNRLRADLRAAVPMLHYRAGGGADSAVMLTADTFSLTIAGQPTLDGGTEFQRVEWRHDHTSGQLMRRVWPDANSGRDLDVAPWVVYLTDVQVFRIEVIRPRAGGGSDGDLSGVADTLPAAIDITIDSGIGPVRVLEALL